MIPSAPLRGYFRSALKENPLDSKGRTYQTKGMGGLIDQTLIKRLSGRGIVKNEAAVVTALTKREEVQKYESEVILEKAFDGSLPSFITAFLSDKKLSRKEAAEIVAMIEEASE